MSIEVRVEWKLLASFDDEVAPEDPEDLAFAAAEQASAILLGNPAVASAFNVTLPDGSVYAVDVVDNTIRRIS